MVQAGRDTSGVIWTNSPVQAGAHCTELRWNDWDGRHPGPAEHSYGLFLRQAAFQGLITGGMVSFSTSFEGLEPI